jgi:FSR family fosmidomycin resistance protein-like MFS transporter
MDVSPNKQAPALSSQAPPAEINFQTGQVATITSTHFLHDVYSAFLAPVLPLLIEKLSLSYTQAGSLTAFIQFPSLLNPLIGYLDDKINLRLLVIFAPAITATTMSCLGLAPNYASLVVLLLVTGLSVAAFHAPSPSMVVSVSGKKTGMGMSFYMAAGELGRTLGPLLAAWAVTMFTLEGIWRLAILGWLASIIMYGRFRKLTMHIQKQSGFREMFPAATRLFIPLLLIVFARTFLVTGVGVYLPTLIKSEGATLWAASRSLAIYQLAGVIGALAGGTLSDRLGRKTVLFVAALFSPFWVIGFLNTSAWLQTVCLILAGLLSLSAQPVMLALVQDHLPNHRSVANGFFMAFSFLFQSTASILIGVMSDRIGLHQAFLYMSLISLISVPLIFLLPRPLVSTHSDLPKL